jgi:hypothetical protein
MHHPSDDDNDFESQREECCDTDPPEPPRCHETRTREKCAEFAAWAPGPEAEQPPPLDLDSPAEVNLREELAWEIRKELKEYTTLVAMRNVYFDKSSRKRLSQATHSGVLLSHIQRMWNHPRLLRSTISQVRSSRRRLLCARERDLATLGERDDGSTAHRHSSKSANRRGDKRWGGDKDGKKDENRKRKKNKSEEDGEEEQDAKTKTKRLKHMAEQRRNESARKRLRLASGAGFEKEEDLWKLAPWRPDLTGVLADLLAHDNSEESLSE